MTTLPLTEAHLKALQDTWRDTKLYPYAHLQRLFIERIDSAKAGELKDKLEECRFRCNSERSTDTNFAHEWQDMPQIYMGMKPATTVAHGFHLAEAMINLRAEDAPDRGYMINQLTRVTSALCSKLSNPKEILYLHAARLVALDIAPDVDKAVEMVLSSAKLIDMPPERAV